MERVVLRRWWNGAGLAFASLTLASLIPGSTFAESPRPAASPPVSESTIVVYADMDDDDNDGRPDHVANKVTGRAGENVRRFKWQLGDLLGVDGTSARLLVGDLPVLGKTNAAQELGLQGVRVGASKLRFSKGELSVQVLEMRAYDTRNQRVNLATSHA